MKFRSIKTLAACCLISMSAIAQQATTITKEVLKDKIKGGWAGQTIGVTFGGPYEFRFNGTFIGDYQPLLWYDGYLKKTMIESPGLYDDLYMDITFVDIFEKEGLDAPLESFANAYANAGYMLWHANQAGRYNLLNGIKAPQSGHWLNNPHADCIDYQIEADFAGLMSPGMPNTASAISDKIGHIMNYGDGWYGGIYVGSMYSLSFISSDVNWIVETALESVPRQSEFYQTIRNVIDWHKQYPDDWKRTWLEVQRHWADDIGCPDGVFVPFNIDAKVNAAYVVIGLLYGNGDFTKSLEISTRCGQDADCNPSTVGGVLGTILGYEKIPAYWKLGLAEAESIDFKYTTMSLNKVYETGYKHALANLERNGAKVNGNTITLPAQKIVPVRFEKSFDGHYPLVKMPVKWSPSRDEFGFEFDGIGFVIRGEAMAKADKGSDKASKYVIEAEVSIDGKVMGKEKLPVDFTTRRHELAWKYQMEKGRHSVKLRILNPSKDNELRVHDVIIYSDKPVDGMQQTVDAAGKVR